MKHNCNLKSDHFQSSFLFFLVFLPLLYIQKTYPGKMFIKQDLKSYTIPKALLLPSISQSFFSNYLFRVCSLLPRYIIVLIVLNEEDFLVSCSIESNLCLQSSSVGSLTSTIKSIFFFPRTMSNCPYY